METRAFGLKELFCEVSQWSQIKPYLSSIESDRSRANNPGKRVLNGKKEAETLEELKALLRQRRKH